MLNLRSTKKYISLVQMNFKTEKDWVVNNKQEEFIEELLKS